MSIARKRAKVKKKSRSAARGEKRKKKVSKRAAKASVARTKKKRSKKTERKKRSSVTPRKKVQRKKRPSVDTKRITPRKRPKPKPKPKPKRKKKRRRKVSEENILQQIAERFEVSERIVTLTAFLQHPPVAAQIRDRIIEKGLAELRAGMVQSKETVILGQLIVAEQLGIFDQRAHELAAEYDMPVREVYELWHSPKAA
jgi:hypothetical protein